MLSGAPIAQFFCHCDDCQAVHGGAYLPVAVYPSAAVEVTSGETTVWALKTTPRTSCTACGTRLFAELTALGVRCVTASLLPAGDFAPTFHMNCRFAVRPITDDLPHFDARPPAFGGSDARVGW